jgi:hypothetical protein
MKPQKVRNAVTPAKAGVQNCLVSPDSRFHRNTQNGMKMIFSEAIHFELTKFFRFDINTIVVIVKQS